MKGYHSFVRLPSDLSKVECQRFMHLAESPVLTRAPRRQAMRLLRARHPPRTSPSRRPSLLSAQHGHRVNSRGPPNRQQCGDTCNRTQHTRGGHQRYPIEWFDAVDQAAHTPTHDHGQREPPHEAADHAHCTVCRDERDEIPSLRSQGRTHAELTHARSHDEREQAIDAQRRHEERQPGEGREESRLHFAVGDLSFDDALERPHIPRSSGSD